jgi:hypothetical protein
VTGLKHKKKTKEETDDKERNINYSKTPPCCRPERQRTEEKGKKKRGEERGEENKKNIKKLIHHAKNLPMLLQEDPVEGFGEHIGQHVLCGYMEQGDLVVLEALPNEVVARVDMLGARVVFWIFGEGFGALIIDMERDLIVRAEPEFGQDMANP